MPPKGFRIRRGKLVPITPGWKGICHHSSTKRNNAHKRIQKRTSKKAGLRRDANLNVKFSGFQKVRGFASYNSWPYKHIDIHTPLPTLSEMFMTGDDGKFPKPETETLQFVKGKKPRNRKRGGVYRGVGRGHK